MSHSLKRIMIAIPMAAAITLTGATGALATKTSTEPTTSTAGPTAMAIGGGPELMKGTPEQLQAAFEAINKRRAAQGVAPVKYSTIPSHPLEEPPPGYTASSGTGGAVTGDNIDHTGVEAAVFLVEQSGVELLADERWTHVVIHLEYSAENSVTTYTVLFYAYPAGHSVPGAYASPKEAFAPTVTVVASAPMFADKSGTAYDTYTLPAKTGVQYYVNGTAKAAGTYKATGTVTVTAKAKTGYALTGTTTWKRTFSKNIVVTPAAATFSDKSGTAYDRYTIPAKTGVQYYVNGTAKAAGTYKATGTVTVTAKAKTGYALTGTTSWKKAFSKNVVVTPTTPVFTDKAGTTYDRYTIPAKTGVQYYVNGTAKAAGTYKVTGTVTVTAKAKTGYALTGTTTWKRTYGR